MVQVLPPLAFFVYSDLLQLEYPVHRQNPEIDQVFLLSIGRVVEFHVRKVTISVDGASEINVIIGELEVVAV